MNQAGTQHIDHHPLLKLILFGMVKGVPALVHACCEMNNPPYFTKQLTNPTTDDIEARLCRWDSTDDSPVEFIELYVK